jgi:PAT family beta-lactamase induction signal transducer AmpG
VATDTTATASLDDWAPRRQAAPAGGNPMMSRPKATDVYAPPREGAEPGAPAAGEAGGDGPPAREDALRGTPWTITTYFAEGLPYSIVHQVSAELFTAVGASLAAVSYTSFYGAAWNFKFLWSPLVARYGTLRRWIVALELLLALPLLAAATRAGETNIAPVALALVAFSFLAATHDIAIDGYYLAALDKPAQTSLSGLRIGAYRVALLVGKSGLVLLAGLVSWRVSFLAAAGMLVALAAVHAILLRPLRGVEKADAGGPAATARAFVESFRTFLQKPKVAFTLAFILTFKAGDALLFNMSVPFLKSLGLDTAMRGLLSTPSLIASIAGTWIGGVWIRRTSLSRTLVPIALLQAFAIPLYSALAVLRPSFWGIAVAVTIEQLIAGLGNAALIVFLMRRADGEHKTAHFAIGTALMSVPVTLAGAVSGDLAQGLGFTKFFLVAFIVAVPGALLARAVPKD